MIKVESLRFRPESPRPWSLRVKKEDGGEAWSKVAVLDENGSTVYAANNSADDTWLTPDNLEAIVCAVNAMAEPPSEPRLGEQPILTKSIFKAEVLHAPAHDDRVGRMEFADIVAECVDGDGGFSGDFSLEEQIHYYDREKADDAILEQGSDPSFFFIDDEE